MTREEQDEKEFEELWGKDIKADTPANLIPVIKIFAKRYWLASRRTLREKEAKAIEVVKQVIRDVTKELMEEGNKDDKR